MDVRKLILLFTIILILPVTLAETFQQNEDALISHPIRISGAVNSNILANISIKFQNSFIIDNGVMNYNTSTTEHEFFLSSGNTSRVGTYPYCITSTGAGFNSTDCFEFEITASGFDRINSGESLIILVGVLIMFGLGIVFLFLFVRSDSYIGKVSFLFGSVTFLLVSILFTTVLIYQNLGGFGNIISGYETFLFIAKVGVTILSIGFFVFVFLFMLKAWRIKNGVID